MPALTVSVEGVEREPCRFKRHRDYGDLHQSQILFDALRRRR